MGRTIWFDANDLTGSKAVLTLQTASARTGDATQERSLQGGEWFDPARYPAARFETTSFRSLGADRLEASGSRASNRPLVRLIGVWRSTFEGDRLRAAGGILSATFSAEKRKALIELQHTKRRQTLHSRQRQAIRQVIVPLHAQHRLQMLATARAFQAERSSLTEWAKLRQDRAHAYAELQTSRESR